MGYGRVSNVWALLLNLHIKGAVLHFYLSRSVYSLHEHRSARENIMFKVSRGSGGALSSPKVKITPVMSQ